MGVEAVQRSGHSDPQTWRQKLLGALQSFMNLAGGRNKVHKRRELRPSSEQEMELQQQCPLLWVTRGLTGRPGRAAGAGPGVSA